MYQSLLALGSQLLGKATTFKVGFNLSPMYRRSTGKIIYVSDDVRRVVMKLPISYKNKNYAGSIFGGSLFASVDPIPMIQLISLLDRRYVVWDKSAEIYFKIPAREDLYAEFQVTKDELGYIEETIAKQQEMDFIKVVKLTNKDQSKVYCEIRKTLYIANKEHYRAKRASRK